MHPPHPNCKVTQSKGCILSVSGAKKHIFGPEEFHLTMRANISQQWGGISSIPQLFFRVTEHESSNAKIMTIPEEGGAQMLACPAHPVPEAVLWSRGTQNRKAQNRDGKK